MDKTLKQIAKAARIIGSADVLAETMKWSLEVKPKLRKGTQAFLNSEARIEDAPSLKTFTRFVIEIRMAADGKYLPLKIGNKVWYDTAAERDLVLGMLTA